MHFTNKCITASSAGLHAGTVHVPRELWVGRKKEPAWYLLLVHASYYPLLNTSSRISGRGMCNTHPHA